MSGGRGGAVLTMALALSSCATPSTAPEPPRLSVTEDVIDTSPGPLCASGLDAAVGRIPQGATVLSRLHVSASRAVPLERVLALVAAHARRRCASGVRILRAEAADGAEGIVSADAVVYALP